MKLWRAAPAMIVLTFGGVVTTNAQSPSSAPEITYSDFGSPHQLVTVAAGRRINLFCAGNGSPTIILSAGGAAWSSTWVRVQPSLARKTRVCSWDRPGSGFSDASPEPQDIAHIAADLEAALDHANIDGRLLLVAHSQGGLESLLFADHRPARVAGMVLIDPAFPDQADRLRRAAPALMAYSEAGDFKGYQPIRDCAAALRALPDAALPAPCARQHGGLPQAFRTALAPWDKQPAYWDTYYSDYEQRDRNSKIAIKTDRTYGSMPIMVFGSGKLSLPGAPANIVSEIPALQAELERGHQELAKLSLNGSFVPVLNSGHAIMLEKPDLVIDAVQHMIDSAR